MRAVRQGEVADILKPDVNLVVARRRATTPQALPLSIRSLPEFSRTGGLVVAVQMRRGEQRRRGRPAAVGVPLADASAQTS